MHNHLTDIVSLSLLKTHRQEILNLAALLQQTPQWTPTAGLSDLVEKSVSLIEAIEARFQQPLVVTLVGPSGAGKSTVLNAVAGVQDFSESGLDRPTTRQVVLYGQNPSDASQLLAALGEKEIVVRSHPSVARISHMLLVDTPDTDSSDLERHRPILEKVIALSDVLLCVFDAENPKRMDHADFLRPMVQRFGGESLLVLLNKCDRIDKTELLETVLPDFRKYLASAWEVAIREILCVSGRSNLPSPNWPTCAPPKHDFDEFDKLENHIFGTLDQSKTAVDRRVENTGRIRDFVFREFQCQIGRDRPFLSAATQRMAQAEAAAGAAAIEVLASESSGSLSGLTILVYQRLSQRWVGPVGWMIAMWGRLLIFGTGLAGLLRFGSPVQQAWAMVSSLRRFRESRKNVDEIEKADRVADALIRYQNKLREFWPDIAEQLIQGRFDPMVRRELLEASPDRMLGARLEAIWRKALDATLDLAVDRLSGGIQQTLLNLPPMAVLGYMGWITVREFFSGRILSSDFFLHGFLTFGFVLFFSFLLLQIGIRALAHHRGIGKQMLAKVYSDMSPLLSGGSSLPLAGQVSLLLQSGKPAESAPPLPDGRSPDPGPMQTVHRLSEHH